MIRLVLSVAAAVALAAINQAADVLRSSPTFAPRFEEIGGNVSRILAAADGAFYVTGQFSGVGTAPGTRAVRFFADGSPDLSFRVAEDLQFLAVEADGQLLGVRFLGSTGTISRYGLVRLNTDGSVDTTFSGAVAFQGLINTVAVQPDGTILVGGSFGAVNDAAQVGLARLHANGAYDADFTSPLLPSRSVESILALPDGDVVIAGNLAIAGIVQATLLRLNADGTHDPGFVPQLAPYYDLATWVGRQADGKLVAAGTFRKDQVTSTLERIIRLLPDGSRDETFAVPEGLFEYGTPMRQVELEPGGSIFVVANYALAENETTRRIAGRLLPSGAPDATFALAGAQPMNHELQTGARMADGRYFVAGGGWISRHNHAGVLDPSFPTTVFTSAPVTAAKRGGDGKWVVAGAFTHVNGIARSHLARLNGDGSLDDSFAPTFSELATVNAVMIEPDQSVIVGGSFSSISGVARAGLARIQANNIVDPGFASGSGFSGSVLDLVRQPGGRLIAIGHFTSYDGAARAGIVALQDDGSLDPTFNVGTGFQPYGAASVAVLPDGKLVCGGLFGTYNGAPRLRVARLHSDGTLDTGFDPGSVFYDAVNDVAAYPDGRVLVASHAAYFNGITYHGVARLTASGAIDPTFVPGTGQYTEARCVVLGADDSVWLGGSIHVTAQAMLPLVRLQPNGVLGAVTRIAGRDISELTKVLEFVGEDLVFAGGTYPLDRSTFSLLEAAPVPVIITPPQSRAANTGDTVVFSVSAQGPELSYQWLKDGRNISGATGAMLTLNAVQLVNAGSYAVRITNRFDSVMSAAATLAGPNPAPSITSQPGIVTATEGTVAVLQVTSNAAQPTYQWRRAGVVIPGATSQALTLSPVEFSDAGFYDVIVGDGLSGTVSQVGRLIVYPETLPNVYRPVPEFGPKFETRGGTVRSVVGAPGGKAYVVGDFTGMAGATTNRVARLNADGTADAMFEPAVVQDGSVNTLAIQPDGKLLLAGTFHFVGGVARCGMARLNTDGSLDDTFTTGSGIESQSSSDIPYINALVLQSDGRVIAGGNFHKYRGVERRNLVRINADGSLDATFAPSSAVDAYVNALALQSDGRVVVAGRFGQFSATQRYLLRLESDGALDSGFAPGPYFQDPVAAIALQPDGRILVGGNYQTTVGSAPNVQEYRSGIVRLLSTGARDETFGPAAGRPGWVYAISLRPDGSIVAGGRFAMDAPAAPSTYLARLTSAGAAAFSFIDNLGGIEKHVTSCSVFPTGEILAATRTGSEYSSNPREYRLLRVTGAGQQDLSFDHEPRRGATVRTLAALPGGRWAVGGDFVWVNGQLQGGLAVILGNGDHDGNFAVGVGFQGTVNDMALDGAGRLVVVGSFTKYQGIARNGIARLLPNGALDLSLASGAGLGNSGLPDSGANAIEILPDGRIIVGGDFLSYDGVQQVRVARLHPDGTLDTTFAVGNGPGGVVRSLGAHRDGRVIVGGEFSNFNSTQHYALVRLNSDGSRDPSLPSMTQLNWGTAVDLLPDEAIVAGGASKLMRILSTGAIDPSFNCPEFTEISLDHIRALTVDRQRRVVFGGWNREGSGILLERLNADGSYDPSFRIVGALSVPSGATVQAVAFGPGRSILMGGQGLEFADTTSGGLVLLEPAPGPHITAQPVDRAAQPGGAVQFSVTATGDGITYQWYRDGVAVAGATSSTLTINGAQIADVGSYTVILTNAWDTITSDPATLSGPNPVPTIQTMPGSIVVRAGLTGSLQVVASGVGPLTYQWRKFGQPISGATSSTLSFNPVGFNHAGFYDVIVADGLSITKSSGVEVRVEPPFYAKELRRKANFAPRFESAGGRFSILIPAADGKFYAGGFFSEIDGQSRPGLVRMLGNGSVDTGFQPVALAFGALNALAIQADGKLLVGGFFSVTVGGAEYHHLVRLHQDGSLDTTFRVPGRFDLPVQAVALQPDGKVLVGGAFGKLGDTLAGRFVRLHPDGSLDATLATGTGFNNPVTDIAVQSTGRILVAGSFSTYNGGSATGGFVRLTAQGGRDSFPVVLSGTVSTLKVLADDRLLVGTNASSQPPRLALLQTNGQVATNFALPVSSAQLAVPESVVTLGGGKVAVLVREFFSGLPQSSRMHVFNADGSLDVTFGSVTTSDSSMEVLLATTDDKFYVGGTFTSIADSNAPGLARLMANGARDSAFAPTVFQRSVLTAALAMDDEGWLIGGTFTRVNGTPASGLVRLSSDGSVDPAFTTDATLRASVLALAQQGDGSIIAGGSFGGTAQAPSWGLVRFGPSGERDGSFAPLLPAGAVVTRVAQLPDGSLIVSGNVVGVPGSSRFLRRVTLDGTVDADYGAALTFGNPLQVIVTRSDGRAYLGESTLSTPTAYQTGLVRLHANGTIDTGFLANGLPHPSISSLVEQFDGKLVVGGSFRANTAPFESRNVVRLNSNGSRDTSFALPTPMTMTARQILAHMDGDILVAGAGVISNAPPTLSPALQRFNADGTTDSEFVVQGFVGTGSVALMRWTSEAGLLLAGNVHFADAPGLSLALLEPVLSSPIIISAPQAPPPTPAGSAGVTLSVAALADGNPTYQWQFEAGGSAASSQNSGPSAGFVDLPGATDATLSISFPQQFHSGLYRVIITANGVSTTSEPVAVTITAGISSASARLLNLSTRALVQTGDNVLIPGFVVSGSTNKKLLIRAVGPTLGGSPFNVPGVLPDPRIVLKRRDEVTRQFVDIANNDDWGTSANFAQLKQTAADLYAFEIPDTSADAALLLDVTPGEYTVIVDDVARASGVAIVELYDADASGSGSRLINISNRGFAGVGAHVMIPGFVVSNEGPKTFLIRAVGPTLASFGVSGTMADPKLTVYRSNSPAPGDTEILNQDNWSANPDAANTADVATQVSAFPLGSGSTDAAFVVTLPPGLYTVHGKSSDGVATGVLLVEIYVVP